MTGPDETATFLNILFEHAPDEKYLLLWTLADKQSRWYPTERLDDAAGAVAALAETDVYVGVSLANEDRGPHRRYEVGDTAGIVGLWADLDYAGDEHRKANLPPDEESALSLLDDLGAAPSVVVHSGHGLQAWWLLDEPYVYDNPDERDRAAELSRRWNLTLRAKAATRSWVLDSTHDLARVMRVPGTTNRKGDPVPVRLLSVETTRRYGLDDFDGLLVDDAALGMLGGRRTYHVGEVRLDAKAQPDVDKLDALRENDAKFRGSWDRNRKDLDDQSASSYDLSLATIAAMTGWTDQEIADLIIASRRKHGDDLKLRVDYYARTISRARDDVTRESAATELVATTERYERAAAAGDGAGAAHARKALLDEISGALGVEVVRMVRFTQDPPRYRIETTVGSITLGDASAILDYRTFRSKVAAATGIVIPRFKTARWDAVAQAIFRACEDEDTGVESTDVGLGVAWLVDYLSDRTIIADEEEGAATAHPYRNGDGSVYIFGPSLRRWLWTSRGDKVTPGRMGEILRSIDAEHRTINVKVGGKRSTRSVWRLPTELVGLVAGETDPTP